ncbi:MAG: nicotinate-nucleotide adenylyltransferase [Rhodospirillales bacterium]|nr:nicotinate-nucleotide adenylyltransferase [Rhodospirillales bacterium]
MKFGRMRRRVGLLGGSFNPAHDGHRHISLLALARLRLDEIWWLVSPQNPLKPVAGMAPFAQRLAGARALARHPRIRVSGLEAELGTRYSVDSLTALSRRFPQTRFVWLMGADILAELPRWRRWTRLFAQAPIACFARPNYSWPALAGQAAIRFARWRVAPARLGGARTPAWSFLFVRKHDASASRIRAQAQP